MTKHYKRRKVNILNLMVLCTVIMLVCVIPASCCISSAAKVISAAYEDWLYNPSDVEPIIGIQNTVVIPKLELPPEPEPEPVVVEEPKVEEHKVTVASSRSSGARNSVMMSTSEVKAMIKEVANEIGLDWRVLEGLVYAESSFNPNLTSSTGRHHGLTQVSEQNYDNLTKTLGLVPSNGTKYFDPYSNLKCGAYILQCTLIKYQDYHKALVIYNMGEGGAKGISSSAYSRKIMNYAENLGFTYP